MAIRWRYEPYRKLYQREQGAFAQLPLYTRGLASELIKFVDDEGRIPLRGRSPAQAVAFICGADRTDRHRLPHDLRKLIEEGYLQLEPDALRIKNFRAAQTRYDKVKDGPEVDIPEPGSPRDAPEQNDGECAGNVQGMCEEPARNVRGMAGNHAESFRCQVADLLDQKGQTAAATADPGSDAVAQGTSAAAIVQVSTARHREAIRLFEMRERMRREVWPECQTWPASPRDWAPIVERLEEGLTPAQIEHALRVLHAQAVADPSITKWLNTPLTWSDGVIKNALGMPDPGRATSSSRRSADEWLTNVDLAKREARMREQGKPIPWANDPARQRMTHDKQGNRLEPCGGDA
jgi:hypothetical protein